MTFKAYIDNIQAKTGKTQEDFWKLAIKNHSVKQVKIVAKHAELLAWLKVGNWTRARACELHHIISAPAR